MIRFLKIIGSVLLTLSIAIVILIIFDFGYIFRGIQTTYFQGHNTAFIDDYPYFKNDTIKKGSTTDIWPLHQNYNSVNATKNFYSQFHITKGPL